ncbi:CIS tube protein [Herbaspirillum rubrisubalbicans]|jgi:nucleoid-associated protein YgaU|nr:hypothetical protein [Herbaspirillum rubrisubalbicans]
MGNMTIVAYSDEKFTSKVAGASYEVMLNPDKLQHNRSIHYNEEAALDSSAPSAKYNKTNGERLSFEIIIDCTGVVDSARVNLPDEIKNLSTVIYHYNGKIHRPNFVVVNWGSLVFQGVMTSFNLSYTFFKPDGTPLRARASLEFTSYIDPATAARQADQKSPDMTHRIVISEGNSLPQIAQQIYRSSNYYIQIAQVNDLNKFRQLKPGSTIIVPPLVQGVPAATASKTA